MAKAENATMERPVRRKAPVRGNYGLITVLIVAAITIIMLVGAIFWYCVHLLNSQSGIFNGVTIAGVDVSGLTRDEAVKRLEQQMDTVEENLTFDVVAGDYRYTVSPVELGLTYDTGSAAAKAYNYGRNGGFFDNIRDVYNAKTTGYNINFDYNYDVTRIDDIAEKIAQDLTLEPVQTTYEINDDELIVTMGKPGLIITPEEISYLLQQRLADSSIGDIVIRKEADKIEELDYEAIRDMVYVEPQDAYLDESDPQNLMVVPSKNGRMLDLDKVDSILAGPGSGEDGNVYVIPFDIVEPEVKTEDVKYYTYNDLIATATTKLNPGQVNRTDNIRLACSKIDGTILLPGDEFSFNTIVGKRTYEAGFKDAAIYMAGEIADGVGGGICQVSSTLYITAVSADLEITSRKNHRYTVTYTKLGQDATVSYDSHVDFKFKNDRETAIKICIVQENDYVKCEFYGELEPGEENKKTTMESKTLKSEAFTTVYEVDESVPVNKKVEKNHGYTGYTVETYRVVTQDGKEVSRTLENTSKYVKLDQTYQINPLNAKTGEDGKITYVDYVAPAVTPTPNNPAPEPDNSSDIEPTDPVNPTPGEDQPGENENPPWINPNPGENENPDNGNEGQPDNGNEGQPDNGNEGQPDNGNEGGSGGDGGDTEPGEFDIDPGPGEGGGNEEDPGWL